MKASPIVPGKLYSLTFRGHSLDMIAAYLGAFEGGVMRPYYLKPHYPIAKLVADQVRAFEPEQWVVVGFYEFDDEIEPMTVRATNLKDLQPGEVGLIVQAGAWLADFDAEWAPYWDDGEPADPDPHYPHPSEIIT